MNNFRPTTGKSMIGKRDLQQQSAEFSPWMTGEEMINMRRLASQRSSYMQSAPNVQTSHMNAHMMPMQNKNFINESSCKISGSSFTNVPNPNIFKPNTSLNEISYPNRPSDRFSYNNSFTNVNMQYKNNEDPLYKDIPPPSISSRERFGLPESISRSTYANLRQTSERFSCMQNNESQFNSKFDSSQMFDEKTFSVSSDKNLLMQSPASFTDKTASLSNNFPPYKQNLKNSNLFPAYASKDTVAESQKFPQSPGCTPDFPGKTGNFCEKTELNRYSNALKQLLKDHTNSYPQTSSTEIDLFSQPSTTASLMYEKQKLKTVPKMQVTDELFKPSTDTVISPSQTKFSFSSENDQSLCQNSNQIAFQKSSSLPMSDLSTPTVSKDCIMQDIQFSSEPETETIVKSLTCTSSFNFDSSLNVSDLADLLPGFDAILKETLNKTEELPKTDLNKSNSAFSDDEWSKHSIPFIGDINQVSYDEFSYNKDFNDINKELVKKTEESDLKSKFSSPMPCIDNIINTVDSSLLCPLMDTNTPVSENVSETDNELTKEIPKDAATNDSFKVQSALEEAIELLVKGDAIVGLDHIIEYKKNICQKGSFPFKCKLCNSAITRPSIIDHIVGTKHRMRYLKTKDEAKYDYIVSLKVEKSEKDAKLAEIAHELEKTYGRGHVTVNTDDFQKDATKIDNSFSNEEECIETVITLDKIPIGFEALSPQHDDTNSANFDLEPTLNRNNNITLQKLDTVSSDLKQSPEYKVPNTELSSSHLNTGALANNVQISAVSQTKDIADSNSQEKLKLNTESCVMPIQNSTETLSSEVKMECGAIKRSASSECLSDFKVQKLDKSLVDIIDEKKPLEVKKESDAAVEKKIFNPNVFDELSKCTISSEEEASVALQAINVLMEMYMRYKLQNVPLQSVESLMKALQSRSPDKVEEIVGLLNDNKISNPVESVPEVKESNNPVKMDDIETSKYEKSSQEQTVTAVNTEIKKVQEFNSFTTTTVNSSSSVVTSSSNSVMSFPNTVTQAQPVPVSSIPTSTALDVNVSSINELTKMTDSVMMSSTVNSQGMNPACLKPPPFFKWSQNTDTSSMLNQVSYANIQGSQSMMWTSAYQQSPLQYQQLQYYQPQTFGNAYGGTQAYPTQYPVMAQNSMQMNMTAAPPLPPPLPPPPPTPSNSQSHYPNIAAATASNQSASQQASLLVASISNPPPPPPPLPLS